MATDKEVNYTPEQEQELVAMYEAGAIPAELAEKFSKSERSIIAKLSRMGVYKSKVSNDPKLKKADMVVKITQMLKLPDDVLRTFDKADKQALLEAMTAIEALTAA